MSLWVVNRALENNNPVPFIVLIKDIFLIITREIIIDGGKYYVSVNITSSP